jgi:two-component system osmolarity sensor histidine kinase EnvZ
MKTRIERHVDQRANLLAAVSHDLRTPLTRMKLELALAKPTKRGDAMKRDLADMEHMIDDYLAFARGEEGESAATVNLLSLLREIGLGAVHAGAEVTVEAPADLSVEARPGALKRALTNLVMNAAVHGERVEISAVRLAADGVEIRVDDDGPGIPDERLEEALAPFGRLDAARNQNEKGVGLGLAIAQDVARGHGGDLTLSRSPRGGLRATLRLP